MSLRYSVWDDGPKCTVMDWQTDGTQAPSRDYTPVEAQQVCDWLNGRDQPLRMMTDRFSDPNDPMRAWPSHI